MFALLCQAQVVVLGLVGGRPPFHHQLLGARACPPRREVERLVDHALRQDLQLHVADDRDPVPRYRRGPQRRDVGDSARYHGEVRVRRGEEVERDVRR